MIEWIDKLFCPKCKFWPKGQLFRETRISRRKCFFNLQLIYPWLVFSWNYQRWLSNLGVRLQGGIFIYQSLNWSIQPEQSLYN